ncbi:MAG: diacylglycerol kinase family lipid kinase, partial [Deltaproteobacteria bacterium]|nr:diacylglycerol kinase family lipid kinase [Deltaproteobacteria bacterium]
ANGATGKKFAELLPRLEREFGSFSYKYTEKPMHAPEITRIAIEQGFKLIVSCGGDGTNNEVLQGFVDERGTIPGDVVMGFLPSGTGGDFKRVLGLTGDTEQAMNALKNGIVAEMDIGRADFADGSGNMRRRYFLNILSFGISGLVDHYVNNSTKIFGGKASFFIGSLRGMLNYRNRRVRLRIDNGEETAEKVNLVAVANGRFFGGSMMVAPEAEINDGLFDIIKFGDLTKMEFISLSSDIYKGNHLKRDKITMRRGSRLSAFPLEGDVLIDLDGEQAGKLPVECAVHESRLRIRRL